MLLQMMTKVPLLTMEKSSNSGLTRNKVSENLHDILLLGNTKTSLLFRIKISDLKRYVSSFEYSNHCNLTNFYNLSFESTF